MKMLSNAVKLYSVSRINSILICRYMASAQPTDPIQKLFVDKIKEYSSKAKSSSSNLVDATPQTIQGFKEEMERVARSYNIKDENKIADLDVKFATEIPLDPIDMKRD